MPVTKAAIAAAKKLMGKYGPDVIEAAKANITAATQGAISKPEDVGGYVNGSQARMQLVAEQFMRSGVTLDDIIPADIAGRNVILSAVREKLKALVVTEQVRSAAGADSTLSITESDIGRVALALTRARAAINQFGSAANYMLLVPNGGISQIEFVLLTAVKRALAGL